MKLRYKAAILTVALSIMATPFCIDAAARYRGYEAFGGEYLVIPLGIIAAGFILEAAKLTDKLIREMKPYFTEGGYKYGKKTHEGRTGAKILGRSGCGVKGNSGVRNSM